MKQKGRSVFGAPFCIIMKILEKETYSTFRLTRLKSVTVKFLS